MLSNVSPWQMSGGTQVLLGDYQRNSDAQYQEQIAPAQLPSEVDYDVIRRGLWESSDMMYKYALGMMAQKMNYLQQNPLPSEEAALADMQPLPAVTRVQERSETYKIVATGTRSKALILPTRPPSESDDNGLSCTKYNKVSAR